MVKSLTSNFGSLLVALQVVLEVTDSGPTFSPFLPPSYPLAVRNPYLSAWLPGSQVQDLPSASPQFWYGNNLSWSVIVRVDGQAYSCLGVPSPGAGTRPATVVSGAFSTTHSIFTLTAGNANLTLDFFSPVSFQDYTRQSLPFSYLTISAAGLGDANPSVQVYSDVDESWTGQTGSTVVASSLSGNTSIFELSAEGQTTYAQSSNEQALWGTAVFASLSSNPGLLFSATGSSDDLRDQFQSNGSLVSSTSAWSTGDVAALAHDLGTLSSTASATYAIGYVREAAINYLGSAQTGYYRATYPDTISAVNHFFDDYPNALSEASDLDSRILETGASVAGQNYTNVLRLSVLQTFGGIDVTISNDSLDTSSAYAFIKEISSDGNVNTVDIIVELIPFFYIFNPEYIRLLLDPVVDYLLSGAYPEPFVIHDIGTNYPNATGHNDGNDEQMPVEETGNLLIMAAVYQNSSGNTTWASSRSSLLDSYAEWLIANGLYPVNQLSTNDGLGSFTNMTQLAVKAAVALSAYGQLTGNQTYTDYGNAFASTIETVGLGLEISDVTNQTYFTITYGSSVWFMLYNLYPARLLNLTLFSDGVYIGQSSLYSTVSTSYGIPLEGAIQWGKTDWQMWSAAVAEQSVREQLIDGLYAYVSNGRNDAPFSDRYWVEGDQAGLLAEGFKARPVLGAHFAIWALES